jgi:hypothetical protein
VISGTRLRHEVPVSFGNIGRRSAKDADQRTVAGQVGGITVAGHQVWKEAVARSSVGVVAQIFEEIGRGIA